MLIGSHKVWRRELARRDETSQAAGPQFAEAVLTGEAPLASRSAARRGMLSIPGALKIYLATAPVDFRKSHDGLAAITLQALLDGEKDHAITARFWAYLGDFQYPYVVYDFTDSRRRDGPENFLTGFAGYLQADAYGGYDGIYSSGKVKEVACWAPARRKWFDAESTDPARAHHALALIQRLYLIERDCAQMNAPARQEARRLHALPILQEFKIWLDGEQEKLLPKSPAGQAAQYALNQWEALTRYCEEGDLAIDNNAAERMMKPCAIGRKNWLFVASREGGRRAAVLMSFVNSCKRNQVEPWAYLRDLFVELPKLGAAPTDEQLEPLLPDHWLQSHPESRWIISMS